jgi:hypothetical protein
MRFIFGVVVGILIGEIGLTPIAEALQTFVEMIKSLV